MKVMQTSKTSRLVVVGLPVYGLAPSIMERKRHEHLKEPYVFDGPDLKKQKGTAGLKNGDATSTDVESSHGQYIDKKPKRKTILLVPRSIPPSGVECKSKVTRKSVVSVKSESRVARGTVGPAVDKGVSVPKLSKGSSIPFTTEEKRLSPSELLIQIRRQREREKARKKIESMACTARLNENLISLREIEMLMGIKPQQGSMAQYYSYKSAVY